MKTVIRCDDVFDVLTRGPFPSRGPDDACVESHLRVCHECRQLAEALRPAIGLMHEAISDDGRAELPRYGGALEAAIRGDEPAGAIEQRAILPGARPFHSANHRESHSQGWSMRVASLVAVSMTGLLSLALLVGYSMALGAWSAQTAEASKDPTRPGFHPSLASLGIPLSCLPASRMVDIHRPGFEALPLTESQRADFACCTRCHLSGGTVKSTPRAVEKVTLACASCHVASAANTAPRVTATFHRPRFARPIGKLTTFQAA